MFERSWTVACPANAGASAFVIDSFRLPGGEPHIELEAWGGIPGGNVYIFEGDVSPADAAARLANVGEVDCLMTVPHGGKGCARIPSDIEQRFTVYFDTNVAQTQAVTLRVRQVA